MADLLRSFEDHVVLDRVHVLDALGDFDGLVKSTDSSGIRMS